MTGKQSISYDGDPKSKYSTNRTFLWFLEWEGEKKALFDSHLEVSLAEAQISVLENLFFLSSNWFFECEHPFIDKSMFIIEPAIPSARLYCQPGFKTVPSNKQHMFTEGFTWFMQSFFFFFFNDRMKSGKPQIWGCPRKPDVNSNVDLWIEELKEKNVHLLRRSLHH